MLFHSIFQLGRRLDFSMVFFSNRCWENFVCQKWVHNFPETVETLFLTRLVDKCALVNQLVAYRPYLEMDQLFQVFDFFQAQFVIKLALSLVFQDGVLRERLAVLKTVLGYC